MVIAISYVQASVPTHGNTNRGRQGCLGCRTPVTTITIITIPCYGGNDAVSAHPADATVIVIREVQAPVPTHCDSKRIIQARLGCRTPVTTATTSPIPCPG